MADKVQKKLVAPKAAQEPKPKATPEYIIRESVFLNHRYIMASESSPVSIRTVTRPNIKWEPLNDEACEMLEKMLDRQVKHSKGDVPTSSHLAAMTLKRSIAKYRGEPIPEDEFLDEEPQDSAGFSPVVRQPKDAVEALRAASAPRTLNLDGIPQVGMAAPAVDFQGEPPVDTPSGEEVPAEEVPAEEVAPTGEESQELEGDVNSDTLAGQQIKPPAPRRAPRKP